MSAAGQRAALAAIGRDLLATRGSAGERRAGGLMDRSADSPPSRFDRLTTVPDWLRWPPERQVALARAVALRALAPTLAGSIDGAWLGGIAEVAGERALDWAIASGAERDDEFAASAAPLAPGDLAAAGAATLRAALPPDLRGYVHGPTSAEPLPVDSAMIAAAVAFVEDAG